MPSVPSVVFLSEFGEFTAALRVGARQEAFHTENDKPYPNDSEAESLGRIERFLINQHSQQKLKRWRDVVHKADRC